MEPTVAPRRRRPFTLRLLGFAAILVVFGVAGVVIGFHNAFAGAALGSIGRSFGYTIATRTLEVNLGEAVANDVRISNAKGEPVFAAGRIAVGYSLRDLLPGGKRLFGLKSVTLVSPRITVIHHPDATYNITLPANAQTTSTSSGATLNVQFHVSGGAIDLVDRFVAAPRERRVRIVDIAADGAIAPTPSTYRAGAVLVDDGRRYSIRGSGRFADSRGFELQEWRATRLPIAALSNFALSTHALVVQAGELADLDLKLGALESAGTMQPHLGMSGRLVNGRMSSAALVKPIRDATADFVVDDDSATVRQLNASLNGLPVQARGVLYGFSAPQVAFAVTARGDLARVRQLSKDIARLPISGSIALQAFAEGPAANPLIFARFSSPNVNYGAYRLDGPRGFVAVSGQEVDVLTARAKYGGIDVAGRGALHLARHTSTVAYALMHARPNALPVVDALVPGMALDGVVVARGVDSKLAARGDITGSNAGDRLDVPFSIARTGQGTVGPVALTRHDGASLYARVLLDPAAKQTAAIVDARALSLLAAPAVALPGLALPPLPPRLDLKLDATLAGMATGNVVTAANGTLHAFGAWGSLRAGVLGAGTQVAARGRLTSSFEQLAGLSGNIGAHGGIDVPFAITSAGHSTVVQIANARFPGAVIRGLPLTGANATLAIAPNSIDISSADLRIADRDVTAQGRFGNGGRVHITAGDFDLAALRAAGVPLANGRATIIADVGGTPARPIATLLAALAAARYAGTAVGGDVGLNYDGAALRVDRATLTYGGAYANATGTVAGLALGHIAPRYNLHAVLEDADIATLARTVKTPLRYPAGTIAADLRLTGAGATPAIAGRVELPEGSINGLNFRDGRVALKGTPVTLNASGGQLTVGSTVLDFAGSASRARQRVRLGSRRIDLADFNDYFDEAEVLAGVGSAALAFDDAPARFMTSADMAFRNLRYRRFVFGGAKAVVRTVRSEVRVRANVQGANGGIDVAANIRVPGTDPLRDIARRSYVDLTGRIAGINLGNVLPAAGISAPVVGLVDGSVDVHGRYPALALQAQAALSHGVAGRLPIERFTLRATAANGRGRLNDLTLVAPGLSASVTGTFGLRPQDAFDLRARLISPDIKTLAIAATGKDPSVTGKLDTRAQVQGTLAHPHLTSSVDVNDVALQKIAIPQAHVDLDVTRQALDVRNGTIALPRGGSIAFDGHAPLSTGRATPIAFDFVPHNVDLAPYSSLLPDGSVLGGVFDGSVGVRGTLGAPQLSGSLTYANGSYRSNTVKLPLTQIALQLNFAGTTISIARLHARATPGSFDGTGSIVLGDLRDPLKGAQANVDLTARNALVSAPKFYIGYIDGTVHVTKESRSPLLVGGDLTFSSARIPYTALVPSGGAAQGPAPVLPDVAFNLGVNVGRDVRVQSGPVDIGTSGAARLGGTLTTPTLDGTFNATDGTVAVYRTFVVQNGSAVSFNPSDGITPSVDATAVTHISDPATDVLLHITGLSTHLSLAFSSQPEYSQQQILGLLVNAQALGAVSGVAQTSGSSSGAGGVSVAGIGEGLLNTQFTEKFLQPFSSKIGGALGLSDLNLSYNTNGAVSAVARRTIGKNVSFTYGEQIGGPTPRTSVGINIGTSVSGAQLTFFQAAGSSQAFGGQALTPYLQSGFLATSSPNYTLQAIEPPSGSGFVFSYQRRFW